MTNVGESDAFGQHVEGFRRETRAFKTEIFGSYVTRLRLVVRVPRHCEALAARMVRLANLANSGALALTYEAVPL